MKAFEEHWDLTGLSEHVNYHPDPEGPECYLVPGINRKEERREGWRAALKWALDHECCDNQGCQYMIDELEELK